MARSRTPSVNATPASGPRTMMGQQQRRRDHPTSLHALQPIMTRILIDFGRTVLEAELFDTTTSRAIAAALPVSSCALTWGEEVYFEIPVSIAREREARAVVTPGEIAYWPEGTAIAIGYGRTPISRAGETRLEIGRAHV